MFAKAVQTDPQAIKKAIKPMRWIVGKAVRIVHQFARELRQAMLDDLGLIPTLRSYISDLPKRKGRTFQFTGYIGVESMDNDRRTVLYRIAQEAITNVIKHANASRIDVSILKIPGGVSLDLENAYVNSARIGVLDDIGDRFLSNAVEHRPSVIVHGFDADVARKLECPALPLGKVAYVGAQRWNEP